ncbi:MAG: ATP-binding cassette domain-containing protein, partial [Lactobacillaceae bacterium]|nr:ATP-binding cassette domain-containing protein [Lactobacillaceae bacterium]
MIKFDHISKKYGNDYAVQDLSLEIEDGELFVLVGPSGSGKTTAMKMINRLVEPTDGDTYVRGVRAIDYDLVELRRGIGYVLQNSALFPNMTIAQNAGIQLEMMKVNKVERDQRVNDLLDTVGLNHQDYANRMPDELSGGEQQRV